jgi:putative flippase GtrA
VSHDNRERQVFTGDPYGHLSRTEPPAVREAIAHSVALGLATLATYLLTTHILTDIDSLSRADDLLGGMWAVIATIFVYHDTYQQSIAAALSRIAATSVSFILCFVYLLLLPFHAWGLALLIALGALAARLAGRPGDAITTAVTTAVVLVVAELSPRDAWRQPILRWVDTVIGVAVAVAAWRIAVAATHGRRTALERA